MNGLKILLLSLLVMPLILVMPVMAALNTIPSGGTAFIGEQGLDITQTGATSGGTLAWYSGSSNVGSGAPTATVVVDDASSFYIAPSDIFGKDRGMVPLSQKSLAFYVQDPSLNIRIFDSSSNFEVTGTVTWVPKGDTVSFSIDSNLYVMANRGVSGAPVTIHIQAPDGSRDLECIGKQPHRHSGQYCLIFHGSDMEHGFLHSGTYTIWAECNANSMTTTTGPSERARVPRNRCSSEYQPAYHVIRVSFAVNIHRIGHYPCGNAGPDNSPGYDSPADYFCTGYYHSDTTTLNSPACSTGNNECTHTIPTTVPGPGIVLILSGIAVAFLIMRRPGTL